MAYSNFTLEKLEHTFGIKAERMNIFEKPYPSITPSQRLVADLEEAKLFPLSSEKAKSEFLITPIFKEIYRNSKEEFTLFSGVLLDVDKKAGLNGICDYLLCKVPRALVVKAPIFCLVEAKYRAIEEGFGQCATEMYAAQRFNQEQWNQTSKNIFGAVSNGNEWVFMQLTHNLVQIDTNTFTLQNVEELLGIFQYIINSISADT